jgi:ubiquinone biosynthesis protein COQ9
MTPSSSISPHDARAETLLEILLAHRPFPGWSAAGLGLALRAAGRDPAEGAVVFPNGRADLLEAFARLIDRRLEQAAAGLAETRLSRRIRALVLLRLRLLHPHKDAVRRAAAYFLPPSRHPAAAAFLARRAGLFWRLAGDRAVDFSWYTKRATLGALYGGTLLVWLDDPTEEGSRAAAFFDRGAAALAQIGQIRRRCEGLISGKASPPPA